MSLKAAQIFFISMFTEDPIALGIFVATIVVLITAVIIWTFRKKRIARQCVLLFGLSGSGKTALFSRLVASKQVETYTSMKENASFLYLDNAHKSIKLVDIPGNERLRSKFMDEYKGLARAVIFVVDSLNFSKEIKEVAELFYSLASDKSLCQAYPPILICCNKQDETMAKSSKVIQSQLEKEMNTVRLTRSSLLDSVGDSSQSNNTFLGKHGKDFQFGDLRPLKVDFSECSAKEGNLDSLYKWLQIVA